MRFETPIYFQTLERGAYDRSTGDYGEDIITEKRAYADVNDTQTDTMRLVYGELKKGSLTIRLQNHYTEPFDRIRIGDKLYSVDSSRKLRVKNTYVVSEVL